MADSTCARCTELGHIEAIKRVKAHYVQHLEQGNWAGWSELFTVDAVAQFAPAPGEAEAKVHHGRKELYEFVGPALAGTHAVMRVTSPDITLGAPNEASGRWSLTERLGFDEGELRELTNFGVYFDSYRLCDDGEWRIARTKIQTVRQDLVSRDGTSKTRYPVRG